jgi:hypothetical protein
MVFMTTAGFVVEGRFLWLALEVVELATLGLCAVSQILGVIILGFLISSVLASSFF